ncbi:MAG: restriction endonuclease [Deltaproteobacteria bacterium]|jgi:hypothetical protein|nr:restriction endonuclease [Deltaproteobacteria bacterium]
MSIWLHRISHEYEISKPLLESGYLSIGFRDFLVDASFFPSMKNPALDSEAKFEILKGMPSKCGWEGGTRTIYNLGRFLVDFKPEDLSLVPSWGTFSLYKLQGSVIPISDIPIEALQKVKTLSGHTVTLKVGDLAKADVSVHDTYDLGYVWPVIAVESDIPRSYADAALTARMKIRQTNAKIDEFELNIQKAVEAFKNNRPPSLYLSIMDSMPDQLLEIIHKELNPGQLEKLIARYFKKIGATEVVIPAKNAPKDNQEADAYVVAAFDQIKARINVQVKHHEGVTDEWAVSQIQAYAAERQNIAGLITTRFFGLFQPAIISQRQLIILRLTLQ